MGAKMSWNETLSTRFLPGYRGNDMSQQFGVAFFFVSYMLCVGSRPLEETMGTFFGLKLPHGFLKKNITLIPKREGSQRSEPGCWGISGACLRITRLRTLHCYQSPPTYLVSSLTPTSFKNSMVADSAFSISWMPVTVHWSWSYQPIIWSY